MSKSDYEKELDRLIDEVEGDSIDEARKARFRQVFDEALEANVDISSELAQASRAYRDFRRGAYRDFTDLNFRRKLVDANVLCELDAAINFLRAATQRAKGRPG